MQFPISALCYHVACTVTEIIATKVLNSTFFHTLLVFLKRIRDHRILRSGLALACRHPGHRPICHVPISIFVVPQRHGQTDRQTDRRLLVAYRDNCYTPFACINMMYDGLLGYCETNRCPEMTLLQTRRHL